MTGEGGPRVAWGARARDVLTHPRLPLALGLLGFALSLPSLPFGFMVDDLLHAHVLRGAEVPGGPSPPWDLYRFADGGPGLRRAIDDGTFIWFTSPELRFSFFRPLASLWVAFDHRVLGAWPAVSHLTSCALYGVLCALVAALSRRLLPGAAGGLAALLFTVDDAHHFPVLWLANRHALLSVLFGVAAWLAHVRCRTEGRAGWLSPLLFAAALASGESAVGLLPYLVAWALWLDPGGRRAGLRALAGLLPVLAVWAGLYVRGHHGTRSSGIYLDPLRQPLELAAATPGRLGQLLLAQLGFPPADVWPLVPPGSQALAAVGAATVALGLLAWLLWATRGHPARPVLALGAVGTLLPACATFPSDRLLLSAGIGASGLLAIAIVRAGRRLEAAPAGALVGLRRAGAMTVGLALLHLPIAAALFPLRMVVSGTVFTEPIARGAASLPSDPAIVDQVGVILSTPDSLMTTYMLLDRQVAGAPVPRQVRLLVVSQRGTVRFSREDERTLLATSDAPMFCDVFSLLYRVPRWKVGERVRAGDLEATVLALGEGGFPTKVRFSFDAPISPASQRWIAWKGTRYAEVPVIGVGEELEIQSTDWATAMSP